MNLFFEKKKLISRFEASLWHQLCNGRVLVCIIECNITWSLLWNEVCNNEINGKWSTQIISISCSPWIFTYVSYLHILIIGFHGQHMVSAKSFISHRVSRPIYTCKWTWESEWLWTHLLIWESEWEITS
jgi:hypothetical protein